MKVGSREWVYGMPFARNASLYASGIETWDGERYDIIPETLGVFLGGHDARSNDIYEDDIVESISWNTFFTGPNGVIEAFRRQLTVVVRNGAVMLKEDNPIGADPIYWNLQDQNSKDTLGDLIVVGNLHEGVDEELSSMKFKPPVNPTNRLNNDKMEVVISVYKRSGKWYTGETFVADQIQMFDDAWLPWVSSHLPANLGAGSYVIVRSTDRDIDAGHFHNALYKYEEMPTIRKDDE